MCTYSRTHIGGVYVELEGAPLAADATACVPSPCQWGGPCPLVNISGGSPVNIATCEHLNMWTYLNVNMSTYPCEYQVSYLTDAWWKSYSQYVWLSQFFQRAKLGYLQPSCKHLKLKRDFCDLYFTEHHNPVVNILLVWRFCWCDISCGEHLKHLLAPIVNLSTKWKSAK